MLSLKHEVRRNEAVVRVLLENDAEFLVQH
jgi:hypothetical protein